MAGNYENTIHLFDRECSIQRRYQKIVEESALVILTPKLRKKKGEAGVMVAKACNYTSTGTVKFLTDDELIFFWKLKIAGRASSY